MEHLCLASQVSYVETQLDTPTDSPNRPRFQLATTGSSMFVVVAGGSLLQVLRSNGTTAGTALLHEIDRGSSGNSVFEDIEAISANGKVFLGTREAGLAGVLYVTDGTTLTELPPKTLAPAAEAIAIGSKLLWLGSDESKVTLFTSTASTSTTLKEITFTDVQRAQGLELGRFVATAGGGIFSVRTKDESYQSTETVFHVSSTLKLTKLAAFEPASRDPGQMFLGAYRQTRLLIGTQPVVFNGGHLILPTTGGEVSGINPFEPRFHVEADEQAAVGQDTLRFSVVYDNGLHIGGNGYVQVISPRGDTIEPEFVRQSGDGTLISPFRNDYLLRRGGQGWLAKHGGRYKAMVSSVFVGTEPAAPQSAGTFLLQRPSALGKVVGRMSIDSNGDGQMQSFDPPLPGVRVYIDRNSNFRFDAGEPFARSGDDGTFAITDLPEGTHNLSFTPQPGLVLAERANLLGIRYFIAPNGLLLRAGEIQTQHFLFTEGANLRGQARTYSDDLPVVNMPIFVDLNENGSKDTDEPATLTASDGTFSMRDVPAGKWSAISIPGDRYAPYQGSITIYPGEISTIDVRQRMFKTVRVSAFSLETSLPLRSAIFWIDSDSDGSLDVGEAPIELNSQAKATITALEGQAIAYRGPSGYRAVDGNSFRLEFSGTSPFAFTRKPLVRVNAFRDFNGNGRQDEGEYTQTGGFHYQVTTIEGDVVYDTLSSASYYFPPTSFELPMAGEYVAKTMYGVNFETSGRPVRFKVRAGEERELLIPYKPD